ncbi:hypothetical protein MSP8886_02979 [Marinomonas spartinae]|uniref:Uncharacterized protein n=1 Tax=Marinomonas spartinae TaxID=1792290 RepID=A0A1A8TKR5_9GAMM|nr:hypothetical protein [Marinomonas spartinae]SBS34153.1 hypothetical protein MSP8886_02979 [Marinomonas spartinae]
MELKTLAIIMLILQPIFVYLYINSVVRPSIFIAITVPMSIFYGHDFLHALFIFGGVNLVGVLLVKLAERKGYTAFSPSYFFSGVICWFMLFGIIRFIASYLSLPSVQKISASFHELLAFPEPVWWPVIAFLSVSVAALAMSATILVSDGNRFAASKFLVLYGVISPILPLFGNYFWISQGVTFLVVVCVLGACQKHFFKDNIEDENRIALGFAGALLLSILLYVINGFFHWY